MHEAVGENDTQVCKDGDSWRRGGAGEGAEQKLHLVWYTRDVAAGGAGQWAAESGHRAGCERSEEGRETRRWTGAVGNEGGTGGEWSGSCTCVRFRVG